MMLKNANVSVIIRNFADNDIAVVRNVVARSIYELCAGSYSKQELDAWFHQYPADAIYINWIETRLLLVAVADNQVVGFAQFHPERAIIEAMHVLPEFTRRGIGTRLVKTLEAQASQRGLNTVDVEASTNAEQFYLQCGYTKIRDGKFKCRNGVELNSILLRNQLNAD
jgi:GNAT superfamily N-acetyltransferase